MNGKNINSKISGNDPFQATPFFFMFIAIELVISVLKQDRKYRMNDMVSSLSAGMFSRLPL